MDWFKIVKHEGDIGVFVMGDHPKTEVLKLVLDQNYACYVVISKIHLLTMPDVRFE